MAFRAMLVGVGLVLSAAAALPSSGADTTVLGNWQGPAVYLAGDGSTQNFPTFALSIQEQGNQLIVHDNLGFILLNRPLLVDGKELWIDGMPVGELNDGNMDVVLIDQIGGA